MEATKARNEEVELLSQKLQVSWNINLHTDRKPQSELNSVIFSCQLKGKRKPQKGMEYNRQARLSVTQLHKVAIIMQSC